MKTFFLIIAGLVVTVIALVLLFSSPLAYVSATWRYKMTVTVETPEGIRSGSAVRELSNSEPRINILDMPEVSNAPKVKGEAVVVDLGARGKLFALLIGYNWGPDHGYGVVYDVYPIPANVKGPGRDIRYYPDLKAGPTKLSLKEYPALVMFKDIQDPKTVTQVLELQSENQRANSRLTEIKADHFEELFGKGVRLKEISIEMTKEPVTWGAANEALSWLEDFRNKQFDGRRFNTIKSEYPLANYLSAGAFSTGEKNDN